MDNDLFFAITTTALVIGAVVGVIGIFYARLWLITIGVILLGGSLLAMIGTALFMLWSRALT